MGIGCLHTFEDDLGLNYSAMDHSVSWRNPWTVPGKFSELHTEFSLIISWGLRARDSLVQNGEENIASRIHRLLASCANPLKEQSSMQRYGGSVLGSSVPLSF